MNKELVGGHLKSLRGDSTGYIQTMFVMKAIQNKTLRTEDKKEHHVGDGTIKIVQEHEPMSVPRLCLCNMPRTTPHRKTMRN